MRETSQNPELDYQARQVLIEMGEKIASDPGWSAKLEVEAWMGNPAARVISRRIGLAARLVSQSYDGPQPESAQDLVNLLVKENVPEPKLDPAH